MQHKSFHAMSCPIARSLERVGEWWSMLIMRDALHGLSRFDEFQDSLGIAPNMLARRLKALVEAGLLKRCAYSVRPRRYAYVPTARGREFRAVLIALFAFGNRHFAPEGRSVTIVDARTGAEAEPVVVDRATGKPIREPEFAWVPGPAAGESTRRRYVRRAPVLSGIAGVPLSAPSEGARPAHQTAGRRRSATSLPANDGQDGGGSRSESMAADCNDAAGRPRKPGGAARLPRNRSPKAR